MEFLYNTTLGRFILKLIANRPVANLCGWFMDTYASTVLINLFIKKNGINLDEYEPVKYKSFNEFFTRKIKKELRPLNTNPNSLIAPSDGLLSAYEITDGLVVPVKQSQYSIGDLLRDEDLAKKYDGGYCLVYRLCVNHYHRYCYVDDGTKSNNIFLKGVLHTVRPVALRALPVFIENCREYTIIDSANFGQLVQMEVGALLIGKIKNHHGIANVKRGDEKGMFLYGGSTIVVLVEPNKVSINEDILNNTLNDIETPVKIGEKIGALL